MNHAQGNGQVNLSWKPPVAIVPPTADSSKSPPSWARGPAKGLGITLILLGILLFLSTILDFLISTSGMLRYVKVGFWCGPVIVLTGSLAVTAGTKRSTCLLAGTTGLSVVTLLSVMAVLILGGFDVAAYHDHVLFDGFYPPYDSKTHTIGKAFAIVYVAVGGISFFVVLSLCILSCRATTCGSNPSDDAPVAAYSSGTQHGLAPTAGVGGHPPYPSGPSSPPMSMYMMHVSPSAPSAPSMSQYSLSPSAPPFDQYTISPSRPFPKSAGYMS